MGRGAGMSIGTLNWVRHPRVPWPHGRLLPLRAEAHYQVGVRTRGSYRWQIHWHAELAAPSEVQPSEWSPIPSPDGGHPLGGSQRTSIGRWQIHRHAESGTPSEAYPAAGCCSPSTKCTPIGWKHPCWLLHLPGGTCADSHFASRQPDASLTLCGTPRAHGHVL